MVTVLNNILWYFLVYHQEQAITIIILNVNIFIIPDLLLSR